MKKTIVIVWLLLLLFIAGGLFWYNDWVFSLPTPVPPNYKAVEPGEIIKIDLTVKDINKPVFLHFFNPDCPCSKFNISNFEHIYAKYNKRLNFVIVVMSSKTFTVKDIQDKFDLSLPVLFDPAIAISCGVYSTPQVVLLDAGHKLYYRGNYNRERYCTDEKTNYAKAAIDGLLAHNTHLVFGNLALTAYGCRLPNCTK